MSNSSTRDIVASLHEAVVPSGGSRHGLVVGIERYRDERLNLRCARKDAQAVYNLMTDPDCGMFPKDNVRLLLDADATKENVWQALSALRKNAGVEDTVWIYYAGHGAPEEKHTYWVTHEANVDDLYGTALSDDQISKVLSDLQAQRLLVLLDCCHAAATACQKNPTRSVLTAEDVFAQYRGQGRVTISSSKGQQKSVELGEVGHGAFTYFLEKGLRGEADKDGNGVVTAEELWDYLRDRVADASQKTGNPQTPVLTTGEMMHGLALTLNPLAVAKKRQVAEAIEKLVGLGDGRLSTEEGELCLEILRSGAKSPAEQDVAAEFEALAAGNIRVATFRRLVKSATIEQAAGGVAVVPMPVQIASLAKRKQEKGRVEILREQALTVVTTPPGARISVDGRPRGEAPVSLVLKAGQYRVQAEKEGYETWERRIVFDAQGDAELEIELKENPLVLRNSIIEAWFPMTADEAAEVQQAAAQALSLPIDLILDLGKGVKLELILIPPGKFLMGSPKTEKDRRDDVMQHEVTISKAFYMGKFEVTQEQYEAVMGDNPSHFKGTRNPVEQVSWDEAREFCKKLSARTNRTIQLPTEAQWEYACRAGTTTAFNMGETISPQQANYNTGQYREVPVPVGSFAPNTWGLCDMHGNILEWCADWYGEKYYEESPKTGPTGPATGTQRVERGGSWNHHPLECCSAHRDQGRPGNNYSGNGGIRVVIAVETDYIGSITINA